MTDLRDLREMLEYLDAVDQRVVVVGGRRLFREDIRFALTRIETLTASLELVKGALPVFERVTRLAHTLASDVPITASSRKHIDAAYEALARLEALGEGL
jgi:hypothetical protein